MKVKFENSLKYNMLKQLQGIQAAVVLRKDFRRLGSPRQISRGLTALIREGVLVRIGSGIYAKARLTPYFDKALPINGFDSVAREALNRLGVAWKSGLSESEYNARRSTQIPVRNIVKLKNRCRRKISYEGNELYFENGINAR